MSNMDTVKNFVQGQAASSMFWTKKHSPVILLVAGTVGVVGTVVLACRATLRVSDALEEAEKRSENEKRIQTQTAGGAYSDEMLSKSLRTIQIQTALKIAKPYLPAVALGIVSIAALTGSHVILSKRNSAIMAAYAGLDRAFKEYRGRVKDEYGEAVDRRFATGTELVETSEKMADGTTKTDTVEKKTGKFGGSPYAVVFDEQSRKFSKAPGQNAATLQMNQSHANDKLKAQGHLTLNEVKDLLDLPRTKEGFVVGWIYDPKNPKHTGDNYVDFGIFTGYTEDIADFIDGKPGAHYITLDFNVDGLIYDKAV